MARLQALLYFNRKSTIIIWETAVKISLCESHVRALHKVFDVPCDLKARNLSAPGLEFPALDGCWLEAINN